MSTNSCRLLDRVAYASRAPSKVTDLVGDLIMVRDTFPYNPDSKTSPKTAHNWASRAGYNVNEKHVPEVIVRDNDPFDITIVDLDHRGHGGRAYKVIDAEMRRFDLREDQLIEIFRLVGILPRGSVNGKFVWGISDSQMHLVLVGGECHKTMIEGAQAKKAFEDAGRSGLHPTEATLQAGHIYQKKDKTLHLFLGRVKRPGMAKTLFAFVNLPEKPSDHSNLNLDNLPINSTYQRYREEHEVSKRWDSMSWAERCQWTWYDSKESLHQQYTSVAPGYYYEPGDIVLMSSPKFEADVGVDVELAARHRANEGAVHRYVNCHGDDLAEVEWSKANGDAKRKWNLKVGWCYNDPFNFLSQDERDARRRDQYVKVNIEYLATRSIFQKGFEWS